jgi:hypothetical protein
VSRIAMIGSGPLEEGHANGGSTMESNYKYAEDLRVDIQQVFHVPPNLVEPIKHATCKC